MTCPAYKVVHLYNLTFSLAAWSTAEKATERPKDPDTNFSCPLYTPTHATLFAVHPRVPNSLETGQCTAYSDFLFTCIVLYFVRLW
jgi:hypothetical protein